MRRPLLALFLLASLAAVANAQEPGEQLTVSVITIEAGDAVFEKFAHNALWIHDDSDGSDVVYNWGLFDFDQKDFFLNYMLGRLDYWMATEEFEPMVEW